VLEHVVQTDPSYAPAWEQLTLRYYYDSTFAGGGEAMFQKSNMAAEKALQLDPNRMIAAGQLITNRVERGELGKAYEGAQALVKNRPESAEVHFVMAYVLRYAGMLEESTRECDTALALDPGNYQFRSCARAFMYLGKMDRAKEFVKLDAGSEWAGYVMPSILLREGKIQEAKEAVKVMSTNPHYHRDLLEACLQLRPAADLDTIAKEEQTTVLAEADPEGWYHQGALLTYCGKKDVGTRMIKNAIEANYCAHSDLQYDPLLAKVRNEAGFTDLLVASTECQKALRSPTGQ